MTHKRISVRRQRDGFSFLEVIIAMAVLGIIASVGMVAFNPRDNLLAARDVSRKMDVNSLLNAHFQRRVEYGSYLRRSQTPSGRGSAKQICSQGVFTNPNCINIDDLVTEFLAYIPRDAVEPCLQYTGYLTYLDNATMQVYSLHMGKMPGDSDITVMAGCDVFIAVSSSSSSVSMTSSSASTSESSSDYSSESSSEYSSDYSSESSSSDYSSESSSSESYYSSESSSSEAYCEYWMWWCQSASSESSYEYSSESSYSSESYYSSESSSDYSSEASSESSSY